MMGIKSKNLLTIVLDMSETQKALKKKASIARQSLIARMWKILTESSTKQKADEEGVGDMPCACGLEESAT